jgi:ABC-type transport system involved in multi-copper enzyme maturation permease subunit
MSSMNKSCEKKQQQHILKIFYTWMFCISILMPKEFQSLVYILHFYLIFINFFNQIFFIVLQYIIWKQKLIQNNKSYNERCINRVHLTFSLYTNCQNRPCGKEFNTTAFGNLLICNVTVNIILLRNLNIVSMKLFPHSDLLHTNRLGHLKIAGFVSM